MLRNARRAGKAKRSIGIKRHFKKFYTEKLRNYVHYKKCEKNYKKSKNCIDELVSGFLNVFLISARCYPIKTSPNNKNKRCKNSYYEKKPDAYLKDYGKCGNTLAGKRTNRIFNCFACYCQRKFFHKL